MTFQALDNQTFTYLFLWPVLPSNPVIPGPLYILIYFFRNARCHSISLPHLFKTFSDSSLSSRSLDPQRGPCWPNQRTLNSVVSNYLAYHLHSSYWNPRLFYLLFSCLFSVFHWVQASWGLIPFPPLGIQNLRQSQAHSGCLTVTICWQIDR